MFMEHNTGGTLEIGEIGHTGETRESQSGAVTKHERGEVGRGESERGEVGRHHSENPTAAPK